MWPQDPGAPTRHRADRAAFCSACFALSGAHEALACVALTAPAAGHRLAPRPPGRPGAAPGQPRAPPPQPARPPPRGPAQQRRCRRARSKSSAGRGARDPPTTTRGGSLHAGSRSSGTAAVHAGGCGPGGAVLLRGPSSGGLREARPRPAERRAEVEPGLLHLPQPQGRLRTRAEPGPLRPWGGPSQDRWVPRGEE